MCVCNGACVGVPVLGSVVGRWVWVCSNSIRVIGIKGKYKGRGVMARARWAGVRAWVGVGNK